MGSNENIFAEFQRKKQTVAQAARKALDFGWIKKEEHDAILKKLDDDKLTIGVIGQMKCGKSTFLNAFIFEDDVLPAATTPMTAALSVITYGPEKKIEAEFYTPGEWDDQKMTAALSLDGVTDDLRKSQIQSAKELVEKSSLLPGPVDRFLGKRQSDSLDNLVDYVGADGKFVSITKAVKVYYPKEYLRGVEIVDTPGFNDPIVSREERTKAFLKQADVVLLMLYAGRPFDATDRQILFKNVGVCGTGRVLIGINKYDIPYESGEAEDSIKAYVENELRKAAEAEKNDDISEILKLTSPVPLSANMALLAEMPMAKVSANETYAFDYKRLCDIFEVSSQKQLREKSHIDNLIDLVRSVIEKEKAEILIRKPVNQIKAAGEKVKAELDQKEAEQRKTAADSQRSDSELDDRLDALAKAERKINRKLDSLGDDIAGEYSSILRQAKREAEDVKDNLCSKYKDVEADRPVFWKSLLTDADKNHSRELRGFREQCGKRVKNVLRDASNKCFDYIRKAASDFAYDLNDILNDKIEDYDAKGLCNKVKNDVGDKIGKAEDEVTKLLEKTSDIFSPDLDAILAPLFAVRDEIVDLIRDIVIDNGIKELSDNLQTLKDEKAEREKIGKEAERKADEFHAKALVVEEQMKELQAAL
ncbi:MAG: dynamin family protein [Marinilabiliaceae bacterium]